MRFERLWAAVAMTAMTTTLYAQVQTGSVANVNADGGYVAVQTGQDAWQAMTSVAASATIDLQPRAGEGEGGGGPRAAQFKFSGPATSPTPKTYSASTTGAGGTSSTSGASRVTSPTTSTTAPTYYSAGWGGTATSPASGGSSGQISGTGTYDPWSITYGSLYDAGANPGDTVSLYYQSGLLQSGTYGPTGAFPAGSGSTAYYSFDTYAQEGVFQPFDLAIQYFGGGDPQLYFTNNGEFDVYLLGSNANDPNASPSDRTGAGDAQRLDGNNFRNVLAPYFGANGTLTQDLNFGIVRRYLVPSLPANGNRDDTLFEWHTNTFANTSVDAVPEPSSIAALGLGAAALLRRRKRS